MILRRLASAVRRQNSAPVPDGQRALVYAFEGDIRVGTERKRPRAHTAGLLLPTTGTGG